MTISMVSDLGLVPQRRLGSLLEKRREEYGFLIEDLARRSMGRYTTVTLQAIEAGTVELDDADIEALSLLYEFNSAPPRPQRSKLIVSADEQLAGSLTAEDFDESLFHDLILRYVALLYLLRNQPIGGPLPLRADDLVVIASAFSRPESDIIDEVERIRARDVDAVTELVETMRRRLVVPAAGLLVGPTPAGALLIVK